LSARIAYVIGRYPAASHAFVAREIEALRAAGTEIETISIRSPHREELRTEADRAAAGSTYDVLPAGPLKLLGAHLPALATRPLRYFGTLGYALRLGRGGRGVLWQLFYFAESVVVWRRCRRLGVGHVHTHFADTATDSALLVNRLDPEIGWSITVHGPDEFAEAATNRLAEKLRRASFVAAVSDDARRRAIEVAGPQTAAKTRVVRLGVDLAEFSPPAAPSRPRTQSGGGGVSCVLCIGRLVERKAQEVLIAALAAEGARFTLTLAGDGPRRAELERLAEALPAGERLRFTGVVGQDEVRELYAAAAIFCLPSRSEGLPAVLIEAMACALPVVATRIDAVPELISDGENGLLVEPDDPEALRAALDRLCADSELRARLGSAARATVGERHDLSRQADQMGELLRSASA
jgi:glycosyltransferase involved in cell wall biosynthesis